MKKIIVALSGLLLVAVVAIKVANAQNNPQEVKKATTEVKMDCGKCPHMANAMMADSSKCKGMKSDTASCKKKCADMKAGMKSCDPAKFKMMSKK